MALIKCAECGSEISSLAPSCPKCGIPQNLVTPAQNRPTGKTSTSAKVIAGILVALSLVAFFTPKKEAPPPPEKIAAAAEKPPEPTPEEKAKQAQEDKRHENIVRSALFIRNRLRNPESLKWEVIKSDATGHVICFGYRAENGFGGMNREQSVVVGTKISSDRSNVKKYCLNSDLIDSKDYIEAIISTL